MSKLNPIDPEILCSDNTFEKPNIICEVQMCIDQFTDQVNELKKEGFANIVISYSMQTGIIIRGNGTHDDLKLQNKN